jgi:thiol-disulfide isomerase/thioredoxin
MGRPRALLIGLLASAAIALLIVFGLASNRAASLGRLAPGLPSDRLSGPPATLSSLLSSAHGRATLITFWASWCGPCVREAPALERFSQTPAGRGRLVGVNWSDALSGARSFIRAHAWTFPVLRDAEGTIGNDYRLTGLPTTFVLDASGHIRDVLRGPQNAGSLAQAMASVGHS